MKIISEKVRNTDVQYKVACIFSIFLEKLYYSFFKELKKTIKVFGI